MERDRLATLESQTRRKRCARCGYRPTVAWLDGAYTLRCDCYPIPPALVARPEPGLERLGKMVNNEIAKRPFSAGTVLTAEFVSKYIDPKASPQAVALFLGMCQSAGLNPLIGEAYLVTFGQRSQIIIGAATHVKWASANPTYAGMRSGVVVVRDGQMIDREGTLTIPGDQLVGGWCEVYGKGWQVPHRHTVPLREWDRSLKGQRGTPWDDHKEMMIQKVAVSQALRRAMPGVIPETYSAGGQTIVVSSDAESGMNIPAVPPVIVDGQAATVAPAQEPDAPPAATQGYCPEHGAAFELKNSASGQFWACPAKETNGDWCKRKPLDYLVAEITKIAPQLIEKGRTGQRVAEFIGRPWKDLEDEGMAAIVAAVKEKAAAK